MADGRTARPGHVTPGARPLRRLRPLPPPSPHPPPSHTAHAHTRARAPRPPLPFYTLLSRSSLLPTPPPPPPGARRGPFKGTGSGVPGRVALGGPSRTRSAGSGRRLERPPLALAPPSRGFLESRAAPPRRRRLAAAASGPGGGVWFVLLPRLHRGGVARAALGVGGSGPGGLRGAVATRVR